jgi:hypothetical protein
MTTGIFSESQVNIECDVSHIQTFPFQLIFRYGWRH